MSDLTESEARRLLERYEAAGSIRGLTREFGWSYDKANRLIGAAQRAVRGESQADPEPAIAPATLAGEPDALLAALRKKPMTLEEIATAGGTTRGQALDWIEGMQAKGHNIHCAADRYSIERDQPPPVRDSVLTIESDTDNTFTIGAMGDTHLCSKYCRLDVLGDLYDRYAAEGVRDVFHTGNWIDGEARFNKFDLLVHGMHPQLDYLAEHYPQRDGITTHAIAGDDHEGWYAQGFGVRIGHTAAEAMREAGRTDWHDLGYMEAYVTLRNANTGASCRMLVMHPGGGSAYAISYTMQKIVESLEGGEKPAVLLAGHYHKLELINVRNVWGVQTGCTQDQTPFMRKKKLEAHVGGHILRMKQDPETGAIVELNGMRRYFASSSVNHRWSHSGPVVLPERRP